jgi:hypothetical protein
MRIPSYRNNDLQSEECIPRLLWNKSDEYYKVLLLKLQIFLILFYFCNFYLNTDPFILLFLLLFFLLFILFLCFHSPFHTMTSSPSSSMVAVQEIGYFVDIQYQFLFYETHVPSRTLEDRVSLSSDSLKKYATLVSLPVVGLRPALFSSTLRQASHLNRQKMCF